MGPENGSAVVELNLRIRVKTLTRAVGLLLCHCFRLYLLVNPADSGAFQVELVVKNQPAKAGDIRDMGLIPRLGRSPGGGHGNPFQYLCLENLLDR